MHPFTEELKVLQWFSVTDHSGWFSGTECMIQLPDPCIRVAVYVYEIIACKDFPPGFVSLGWYTFFVNSLLWRIFLGPRLFQKVSHIAEVLIRKAKLGSRRHPGFLQVIDFCACPTKENLTGFSTHNLYFQGACMPTVIRHETFRYVIPAPDSYWLLVSMG